MLIGTASKDENGKYTGGKAGDQSGVEVYTREWYNGNWNIMLRPKDPNKAEIIASSCEKGCNNQNIGYDQGNRNSLHAEAIKVNYDLSKVGLCECDCSAFVSVCAESAGIPIPYTSNNAPTTSTMRNVFLSTGEFDLYTDKIYLNSYNFLKRGDILVKEGSHTIIVLGDGSLANNVQNNTNESLVLDISENQGTVDFSKLKSNGVSKIILRTIKKNNIVDRKYKEYLSQCDTYGIPVECYKYSYALTVQEAIVEANCVLKLLNGRKMKIWLDLEDKSQVNLGKTGILNIATAFLNTCENAGYEVGIYCGLNWYNSYIHDELKKKYQFWIARYEKNDNGTKNEQHRPTVGQVGWQYTSKGSIGGIKGNVDMSVFTNTTNNLKPVNEPNTTVKKDIKISNTVNASSLNVRRYPNLTAPILYKLDRNEKVKIYGYVKGWYAIEVGLKEWVNKDYIVTAKGKVNATKLNYREDANTTAKLLGQYNNGEIVNILSSKKNNAVTWYLCLGSNDKFGWVSGDYIKPV